MTLYPIPQHYPYRFSVEESKIIEAKQWLLDREIEFVIKFGVSDGYSIFFLNDKDDATLFKLTWVGS